MSLLKIPRSAFLAIPLLLCGALRAAPAQDVEVFHHDVQVHGFGTQGFVYTNDNNWLTMNTSSGSAKFTDAGLNIGSQLNNRVRVAAQGYTRRLGELGAWKPTLDWAMVDVNVKPWLGFRGGKVKTVLGLYNDRQDLDFALPYALLPQSMYPIDLRDATIAHTGGDIYGRVALPSNLGAMQYTAYGGHRADSMHSGYPYLISGFGTYLKSYGGPVAGGDLRWRLRGITAGASRLNEWITGRGAATFTGKPGTPVGPYREYSKHDWLNQFYGQYAGRRLQMDAEYRRYYRDQIILNGFGEDINDVRGWYVAGAYRVGSWFQAGAYYSHYHDHDTLTGIPPSAPPQPGQDHDYDKVVTGRFDLNRYTTLKIEGHFMDGFGGEPYPNGFYTTENPSGFQPKTNALAVRTSFGF